MARCPDCDNVQNFILISDFDDGNGKCDICHGSGEGPFWEQVAAGAVNDKSECWKCSGTGQCQTCGGTGEVYDTSESQISETHKENTVFESHSDSYSQGTVETSSGGCTSGCMGIVFYIVGSTMYFLALFSFLASGMQPEASSVLGAIGILILFLVLICVALLCAPGAIVGLIILGLISTLLGQDPNALVREIVHFILPLFT